LLLIRVGASALRWAIQRVRIKAPHGAQRATHLASGQIAKDDCAVAGHSEAFSDGLPLYGIAENCHRNCHRTSQNRPVLSGTNPDVARWQSQQNKMKW
jgi:hypothetical protein